MTASRTATTTATRTATWTNWAGDRTSHPTSVVRPRDEEEVVRAVRTATERALTVRAVGSGHSFSDLVCTDGVMIDLSRMNRVLSVDEHHVTLQAGITLRELGPRNAEHGLSLENQGDIDAQTMAGALATGTHGTGRAFGNLSSRVVGMRLVTADGTVRQLDRNTTPELLRAARVSLGALGIVTEVTVSCVPAFALRRVDRPRPLDDVLAELDQLVDTHDHFEFFIWPYTRTAMTRTSTRTDDTPSPTPLWKRRLREEFAENTVLGALCRVGRRFPSLVPAVNATVARSMSESRVEDVAHRVYATARKVKFTESEYAIPRRHCAEALTACLDLVERQHLPILFPFEVRFTASDDAYLSTAEGRETCYLAAHQYQGMDAIPFFRAFEDIMATYGGRPHWGKRHTRTASDLRPLYPHWDDFAERRTELDPTGTFGNAHTRRVLGTHDEVVTR
ncbi:D-arabinono-1,4-lactone oxidase [Streptomyces sp. NPDC004237]|uniref:D-arabinono-1,4-lactone oxidase n=1 Tax=Streptomyces sp. NPDC004237 TaxID=3154455 RepID=UPI0033B3DA1E